MPSILRRMEPRVGSTINRRILTLFVAMTLIAAACGDDDTSTSTSTSVETTVTAPPTTTAGTVAPPTTAIATSVETDISRFIAGFGDPGDCIDVTYSGGDFDYAAGVEKVSCEGPHDHEVFYVGEFEAPPGAPWPGEDAIADRVFGEVCIDEFSDSYGSWDDAFTIALWATYPLEEEWDGGLRTFKCSVASWPNDEDGTQLLGPAVSAGITLSGETLAFVAEFDGRDLHLYTYGHDGSVTETRNLTDDGNDGVEDTGIPSWSPDGSTVAFAAQDEDETWDIWVVDIATGEKTQLNDDAPVDSSTAISPDGTKILFTSRDRAQPERDIWVMDLDGENMTQLTDDPGVESTAHWSPDGSQIVYRSNANGSNDIWIMNADGSDQQMLIDNGGDEYDPRWSPNGDIAFISNVTGDFDIWLVGSDGQGAVNLTNHPGDDEYPSWTPDGEFIVFNSNRHGVTSLWMMRADGSDQSSLIGSFPTGWGAVRP